MSWSSVSDEADADPTDEPAPSTPSASGFQFDLGGALERLGERVGPEPETVTGAPAAPSPQPRPEPVLEPTPEAPPAESPPVAAPTPPPVISPPMITPPAPISVPTPPPMDMPAAPAAETPAPPAPVPPLDVPAAAADPLSMPAALPRRQRSSTRAPQPDPMPATAPTTAAGTAAAATAAAAMAAATASPPAARPAPASEILPTRETAPLPAEPAVVPPARQAVSPEVDLARRSVFDDAAPAPELPLAPTEQVSPPARPPVIPPSVVQTLPTLPTSNPTVTPIEEATGGPIGPDIHAVRSYQLRAERHRPRSKLLGRSMLSIIVIAGLVAAALFFGRPLLFPQDWDAALTPRVDEIQTDSGLEFTEVVELSVLPDEEYAPIALAAAIGDGWDARYAEWRALGIAQGDPGSAAVTAAVLALRPAVYDPVSNRIYQAEGADAAAVGDAHDVVLHEVFLRQQATPPNADVAGEPTAALGVTSSREINSRALDRALSGATAWTPPLPAEVRAPLPVLYELAAVDRLGTPLLQAYPDNEVAYGDPYPDEMLDAGTARRSSAGAVPLPADAEWLAVPVALGSDAWSLVWDNRLPSGAVDRLATLVIADSYRPLSQSGTTCFVASFATTSQAASAEVVTLLTRWALAAPAEASAVVTQSSPTQVQLTSCDPGAGAEQPIDPTVVDAALNRQLARVSR